MVKANEPEMPRISYQGLLLLRAFVDRPRKELCGADLMKVANLASGTLYPLLLRFEKHGILESEWENVKPETAGRPRRRLYKITPHGAQIARRLLSEFSKDLRQPEWLPGFSAG